MAVFAQTSAAKTQVSGSATRLKAVELFLHPQQVNAVYIQLFDVLASGVTLGVTLPDMVLYIGNKASTMGGTVVTKDGTAYAGDKMMKFIFPGGGVRFNTALTFACTTTSSGATLASTTSLPTLFRINYTFAE